MNGVIHNKVYDIEKFIEDANPTRIYLDVDGVLLHSCQAVCDVWHEEDFPTKVTGQDIVSWNFKELNFYFTNKQIEKIFSSKEFFNVVKRIDGAFEFIKRHKDKAIIVTKGTTDNIRHKMHMFNDVFKLNVPVYGLTLDHAKSVVDMRGGLLIDDCVANLRDSNAKYKIQFLEYDDGLNDVREWTKGWKGFRMYEW